MAEWSSGPVTIAWSLGDYPGTGTISLVRLGGPLLFSVATKDPTNTLNGGTPLLLGDDAIGIAYGRDRGVQVDAEMLTEIEGWASEP